MNKRKILVYAITCSNDGRCSYYSQATRIDQGKSLACLPHSLALSLRADTKLKIQLARFSANRVKFPPSFLFFTRKMANALDIAVSLHCTHLFVYKGDVLAGSLQSHPNDPRLRGCISFICIPSIFLLAIFT